MHLRAGPQRLRPEARRRHAHLYGGFAHAIKCVAAGLGGRAFLDQVAQHRCGGKDGKVDIIQGLVTVSSASIAVVDAEFSYQETAYSR